MANSMKFYILGPLRLESETGILTEDELRSKKLLQLLTFILMHRNEELSHQRLIDTFCDPNGKGPADTLKNLIYRLRVALKPLGDEEFICTLSGAYQWNPEIPVTTDYDEFENIVSRTMHLRSGRELNILCNTALECFRGDFSHKLMIEPWFARRAEQFQQKRIDLVKTLCRSEELNENWTGLEHTCSESFEFETSDEDIHCWMIRSLCGQHKYEDAIRHYELAKRLIYEATGNNSPEHLQRVYSEVVSDIGRYIRNIGTVLIEAGEVDQPKGAYLCEYETFRQIYQIQARKSSRMSLPEGHAEYILLLSIVQKDTLDDLEVSTEEMEEVMGVLSRTIQTSLRVGDVFSRCSPSQFIILLGACTFANGEMIAARIRRNFNKNTRRKPFQLIYDLDSLKTYELQQQIKEAQKLSE